MPKPPFDPNKPFQAATDEKPPFDPSKPFQEASAQPEQSSWKGYVQGALNSLPVAGAVVGGVAGAPLGPLGAVGGAGVGGYTGEALKKLGEGLLQPKINTSAPTLKGSVEAFKDPVEQGLLAAGSEGAGQIVGKGLSAAAGTKAGQAVGGFVKKGATKIGEALTGVPEKVIETYAKAADKVKGLLKSSGGEIDTAADQVKDQIYNDILSTKKQLGSQIGTALQEAPKDRSIDIYPIVKKLEEAKAKLNPNYKSDAITHLDEMIAAVKSDNPNGKANLQSLNEMKEYLQEQGKSAYFKGGQLFSRAKDSANTAKYAAAEARSTLNELAPNIKQANGQLAELHDIEDNLNKSLITSGKSNSALMAVGSGASNSNSKLLERIGKVTGTNPVEQAETLAAARAFNSPKLLTGGPETGILPVRIGAGAALGAGGAHLLGVDEKKGAMAGAALTSPLVLKKLIDSGSGIQGLLSTPAGQSLLKQSVGRGLLNRGNENANGSK